MICISDKANFESFPECFCNVVKRFDGGVRCASFYSAERWLTHATLFSKPHLIYSRLLAGLAHYIPNTT